MNDDKTVPELIRYRRERMSHLKYVLLAVPAEDLHNLAFERIEAILGRYTSCRQVEVPPIFKKAIDAKKRYLEGKMEKKEFLKIRKGLEKYEGLWRDLMVLVLDATHPTAKKAATLTVQDELDQLFWFSQLSSNYFQDYRKAIKEQIALIEEIIERFIPKMRKVKK